MVRILNQYVSPKGIVQVLLEGALITLSLLCAVRLRFWDSVSGFEAYVVWPDFGWQAGVFVLTLQVCFYYCDLYRPSAIRGQNEQWIAIGQSLGSGCLLLGIVYFLFPWLLLGRGIFFITVMLVPFFLGISRAALDRIWQAAAPRENILVIGSGDLAMSVASELFRRTDLSFQLVGFVGGSGVPGEGRQLLGVPVLNQGENLKAFVDAHHVTRVIVALEDRRSALPIRELVRLRVEGIRVEDVNSTMSSLSGRVWLETVKPSWFVFTDGFRRSTTTQILKRAIDLAAGMAGLFASAPIMILVAIAVRLDSPGPVIFRQRRVGLRGKCFELLKFRSMRVDAEASGRAQWATDNDPRATRLGHYLRKYRLDELPQFVNVIRGEMSLVGPRPERPEFVDELRAHISYYDERHSVRPGLTGWAQVQYRYGSSVEDAIRKLEYDLFYLKNMSILFDCAILIDTVRIVAGGNGSN
jgi:sugar transferase (PEP-CTERM system associated)